MPRGGRRSGTPGATYSNRTDLQQGPRPGTPLPVTTAPGQPYGAAKAQADAQKALPLRAGGTPQPAPTAGPAGPPTAGPDLSTILGSLPPMGAPSGRPGEPLTAGMSIGAGPGPDALTPRPTATDPVLTGLSYLNALGDALPPELKAIRDVVGVGQAQT